MSCILTSLTSSSKYLILSSLQLLLTARTCISNYFDSTDFPLLLCLLYLLILALIQQRRYCISCRLFLCFNNSYSLSYTPLYRYSSSHSGDRKRCKRWITCRAYAGCTGDPPSTPSFPPVLLPRSSPSPPPSPPSPLLCSLMLC